eukprot:m.284035 g.284035  ORF g.284035 m.284035 type:complete len:352 (-) comp19896_c0_seq2:272-1327(-)
MSSRKPSDGGDSSTPSAMDMPGGLTLLSRPVLLNVLRNLDFRDVCHCACSCKYLNGVTRDAGLWKYLAFQHDAKWAAEFDQAHGYSTRTDWRWELRFHHVQRVKLRRAGGLVKANKGKATSRLTYNISTSARAACNKCWRPVGYCLCDRLRAQPFQNTHVHILVLQHPKCQVSIGTLRILRAAFTHVEIIVGKHFDIEETEQRRAVERFMTQFDTTYLLYPSDTAVAVNNIATLCPRADVADAGGCDGSCSAAPTQIGLIAIDGSWRQAKSIYRSNPWLATKVSQHVKVTGHPPSLFASIKKEPNASCLSTVEAVASAVVSLQHASALAYQPWVYPALELLCRQQLQHYTS